jgi:hypothetical protein
MVPENHDKRAPLFFNLKNLRYLKNIASISRAVDTNRYDDFLGILVIINLKSRKTAR